MSLHCEVAFFCYVIRYATLGAHERRESKNVVYLDLLSWTESGAQHAHLISNDSLVLPVHQTVVEQHGVLRVGGANG